MLVWSLVCLENTFVINFVMIYIYTVHGRQYRYIVIVHIVICYSIHCVLFLLFKLQLSTCHEGEDIRWRLDQG